MKNDNKLFMFVLLCTLLNVWVFELNEGYVNVYRELELI